MLLNKLNKQMIFDNKSQVLKKTLFGAHYFKKKDPWP